MGSPQGLSDALFTRTQQRVLGLLFANPDRSFHTNEVVRLSGVGTGTVHRELARLLDSGLVSAGRLGNQKHFQANRRSPIFEELRGIVVKTFGLADVLREAISPYAGRMTAAFIYGSIAKGIDKAQSDVDLMIVSESLGYTHLYGALLDAERRLGRKVNPAIYTPVEFAERRAERDGFMSRVLQGPRIYLLGSDHDLPESRKARTGRTAQG